MPLPLAPIAVGLIAASVAIVRPKLVQARNRKRLAILGGQHVGKTTLLSFLARAGTGEPSGTADRGKFAGIFTLTVDSKTVEFRVRKDLRGDVRTKLARSRQAFMSATHVWYLFRSDLIREGDAQHILDVKRDLDTLKEWADEASSKAPKILLVGTFADQSPFFEADADAFLETIRSADPIKLGRKKFADPAKVVVGSLTPSFFKQLVDNLERSLD
ncbi:hypothetical protein [Microbacterium sp. WCS2018Hpa-9]|uniref:hypothetical protein n=1 Tax=Microbacterium sp. WCS2018Hpa-9 TaxID=3073635 RepID=UPI00288BC924|nr:hypothetical protein [Microbacterium sp. WCS2018Hpa-9]